MAIRPLEAIIASSMARNAQDDVLDYAGRRIFPFGLLVKNKENKQNRKYYFKKNKRQSDLDYYAWKNLTFRHINERKQKGYKKLIFYNLLKNIYRTNKIIFCLLLLSKK